MINIFETSFEARDRRFQIEKLYHGETVDLVGVVTTNGVPQNITGYAVSGVFQPTSMNGSPDFYELSADIVENKVIVHWEKGKDFGENSYMVWALLTDGDNASYPIAWRLDMAYSPSYPLSDLAPIPKAIDFSKYDLINAPWLALSDVNDLPYLPLSGGSVNGNLFVNGTISANGLRYNVSTTELGLNAEGNVGTAIGYNAKSSSMGTALGVAAEAKNETDDVPLGGTALGFAAKAKHMFSLAVGQQTSALTDNSIAVGYNATASGGNSIVVGQYSSALTDNAIQIGSYYDAQRDAFVGQTNDVPHSLRVMDKMVLSGDNLTLDPERVPYLSGYAKKEEIPEVPTDLSAFTNSPGYLTAHQSLSDYYTKTQTDEKLTAYAQLSDLENIDVGDYLPLSGGTVTGRIFYGELSDVFTNHQEFYVSEVSATFFFDLELSAERSFLKGTYPYTYDDYERNGNVRMRIKLDGDPQIYEFGSDVVHILADLDDQTEEWLGTFTFHTENDFSDPGFNGRYPNNDNPSIATFDQNSSDGNGILPAGDPPTMDLYVWNTNEGQYDYLTQVSFQKCWDSRHPLNYLTQAGTRDPFVLSSELSDYATTSYVDIKIGDINSILDSINGQVI